MVVSNVCTLLHKLLVAVNVFLSLLQLKSLPSVRLVWNSRRMFPKSMSRRRRKNEVKPHLLMCHLVLMIRCISNRLFADANKRLCIQYHVRGKLFSFLFAWALWMYAIHKHRNIVYVYLKIKEGNCQRICDAISTYTTTHAHIQAKT